jgi:hypothetical protein
MPSGVNSRPSMPGSTNSGTNTSTTMKVAYTTPVRTSRDALAITSSTGSGCGAQAVFFEAAQHVFHAHHRVVHQLTNGNGQAAQRHGVDRQAHVWNTSAVASSDSGMATSDITVVRTFSKNKNRITATINGAVAQRFFTLPPNAR